MANEQNLISQKERTAEERRKVSSLGGKARAKSIQRRKTLKEELLLLLETEEFRTKISTALIKEAEKGNVKAFEVIRDTIGEKPKDIIQHEGEINNPYSNLTEEELRKLAQD